VHSILSACFNEARLEFDVLSQSTDQPWVLVIFLPRCASTEAMKACSEL
jgi:hypothetical protein